jgi:hypothetical protein
MYDKEYFLVANSINRYSLSSRDKFQHNQDGSVDLYIQKKSPGGGEQSNWLPATDGDFILMLRLFISRDTSVVYFPGRHLFGTNFLEERI